MPKLVILGNGFDLQCGLKSSYHDFYNYLRGKMEQKENKPIKVDNIVWLLLNSYHNDKKEYLWKDIEQLLESFLNEEKGKITEYKINYKEIRKKYFENLEKSKNKDYLGKISKIKSQEILFTKTLKSFQKWEYFFENEGLKDHNIFFELFYKDLNEVEKAFRIYLKDKMGNQLIHESANKLYLKVLNVLENETMFDFSPPNYEEILNELKKNHFLSFNYTRLGAVNRKQHNFFTNIHGCIEDFTEIIFGIDSQGVSPNNPIYIFTKTHRVSLLQGKKIAQNKENVRGISLENINEIIIYGHSLNKQDYSYFFGIFNSLNINISKVKILLCYSNYIDYNGNKKDRAAERSLSLQQLIYDYEKSFNIPSGLYHRMLVEGRIGIKEI